MFRYAFALVMVLLFSAPLTAQIKISCIGNSITAAGYPQKLQTLLGSGYNVHNGGVGGTSVLKRSVNPYSSSYIFPYIFTFKPEIITIKLGTNDSQGQNWGPYHGSFAADYNALIDTFLTISPKPQIWLVLCTPAFVNDPLGGYGVMGDTIDKDIVPIIRSVAAQRNLPIIDCHTPLLNRPELFSDGIHPTDAGSDSIAQIFYRSLRGATERMIPAAPKPGIHELLLVKDRKVSIGVRDGEFWTLELVALDGTKIGRYVGKGPGLVRPDGDTALKGVILVRLRAGPSESFTAVSAR